MLIAFRVDASLKMGTGHTYRMLTLAHKLKSRGHTVFFISRNLQGNLIEFVRESFDVLELPKPIADVCVDDHCAHGEWLEVDYDLEIRQSQSAIEQYLENYGSSKLDWLVIDHYAIEQRYQQSIRYLVKRIMQVDDLADRSHHVDILLDQNYYKQSSIRYQLLIPDHTQCLCGPEFALLREEFVAAKQQLESYMSRLRQREVVLFFGGIDIANETSKALKGLLSVDSQDHFKVIIGSNNPHIEHIVALCEKYSDRVSLHVQVNNMTDFFSSAYLYVGAVGATTWERCVMALPGLVCSVAENQTQVAKELDEINAHTYLGLNTRLSEKDYTEAYKTLLSNINILFEQSDICGKLVNGIGTDNVADYIEEIAKHG